MAERITPARMIAARSGRATYISDFLRCVSAYPGEVIWVFEGKDVKYYGPKIDVITGRRARAVVSAGGKSKVLDVLRFAEENEDLSDVRFACFVDRDFDSVHPSSPRLYITPGYSIENLYVTKECLAKVLQVHFECNSSSDESDIERLVDIYSRAFGTVAREMVFLNAWIKLQKDRPGYKLQLNEVGLDDFFEFAWSKRGVKVRRIYGIRALSKLFPDADRVSVADVESMSAIFSGLSLWSALRGKYLFEFFHLFICRLVADARLKKPLMFSKRRTVTLQCSKVNFLSEVSACADTPPCLRSFLLGYA